MGGCRFLRASPGPQRFAVGEAVTVATLGSFMVAPVDAAVVVFDESPLGSVAPTHTATPAAVHALVEAGALGVRDARGNALDGAAVCAGIEAWAMGDAPRPKWTFTRALDIGAIETRMTAEWPAGDQPPPHGLTAALVDNWQREAPLEPMKRRARGGEDDPRWTWTVPGWTSLPSMWADKPVVVLDATATDGDGAMIARALAKDSPPPSVTVRCDAEWASGTRVVVAETDAHRDRVGDRENRPQRAPREAWASAHAMGEKLGGAVLHVTHKGLRSGGKHPAAEAVVASWGGRTMHFGEAGARGTNAAEECETVVMDTHSIPKGVTLARTVAYREHGGLDQATAERAAIQASAGDWIQALHRVRPHRSACNLVIVGPEEWAAAHLSLAGLPDPAVRWRVGELDQTTAERTGDLATLTDPRGWLVRFVGEKMQAGQAVEVRTSKARDCENTSARARKATPILACPASIGGALRALHTRFREGPRPWTDALADAAREHGWTVTPVRTDAGGHGRFFAHRLGPVPRDAVCSALEGEGVRWWKAGGRRVWIAPPPELERLHGWFAMLGPHRLQQWAQAALEAGDDTDAGVVLFPEHSPDSRRRALARSRSTLAEYRGCSPDLAFVGAALDWIQAFISASAVDGGPRSPRVVGTVAAALSSQAGDWPVAVAAYVLASQGESLAALRRGSRGRFRRFGAEVAKLLEAEGVCLSGTRG